MNRDRSTLVWGIALVALGALLLAQTQGLLENVGELVWAIAFALGGVAFIALYLSRRQAWGPIIPGLSLLGLGALMGLEAAAPSLADTVGAPLFLASIGASFWVVFATERKHWWAIIPGGVLVSTALLVLLDGLLSTEVAWVMLLGLAVTFFVVSLQRNDKGERLKWALIPSGVLALVALGVAASEVPALRQVWPLVLVVGGGVLVWRALASRRPPE